MFSTISGGTTGSGLRGLLFKNRACIIGTVSTPNVQVGCDLIIDGVTDASSITNTYYHIVFCCDAKEQKIYINGENLTTQNLNSIGLNGSDRIMKLFDGNLVSDMKLVRVYNSVLTDEQVTQNYNNVIKTMGGE